ncbi:hypothetical protein SCWH03_38080 [Streptomyces pacificus]|uniref:Uncharacterized protein n=1 Tax=Streptomyces pacificus TaxID=2705029 RepID=A0A6A0AX96_9ACTN|nr:hypothetical protein SCWH03_38080 [Streptomyces pacificus]
MSSREERGGEEEGDAECGDEGDDKEDDECDDEGRDKGEPFTRVAPAPRAHRHAEGRIGSAGDHGNGSDELLVRGSARRGDRHQVLTSVCTSVLVHGPCRASRTAARPH